MSTNPLTFDSLRESIVIATFSMIVIQSGFTYTRHDLNSSSDVVLSNKEIALATFLNIVAAFVKAFFLSMEKALQNCEMGPAGHSRLHSKR